MLIIDNVIDYLQENFKELSPVKPRKISRHRSATRRSLTGEEIDESSTDVDQYKTLDPTAGKRTVGESAVSAKQAMANHSANKKALAKAALSNKLARIGVVPSQALHYKK